MNALEPGIEIDITPAERLHSAILMTSYLLLEGIKVATRPGWQSKNCFTNALDSQDIMQLPAIAFPEMVALPANTQIQAPVMSRIGSSIIMLCFVILIVTLFLAFALSCLH